MPEKRKALVSYTPATFAYNMGEDTLKALEGLRDLSMRLGLLGVKAATKRPIDAEDLLTKVKYFSDIIKEIPGQYRAADIPGSLPVIPGSPKWSEKQKDSAQADFENFNRKTGIVSALPPMAKLVLRGGERIFPSGVVGLPETVSTSMDPGTHPLLNAGAGLGALAARKIIKSREVGVPRIASQASAMDILKPMAGFGGDVLTDPLSLVAGGAGRALKGIKTAAAGGTGGKILKALFTGKGIEPKIPIGKQTFEAFGEAYPRFFQMISELPGINKIFSDSEKVYEFFRAPSKLLSNKFKRIKTKTIRNISNFEEKATKVGNKWASIKDPRIRYTIGRAIEAGGYDEGYKALQRYVRMLANKSPEAVAQFKNPVKDITDVAKNLRRVMTKAGSTAVDAGLVARETFEANKDTYVRRMFRQFVENEEWVKKNPKMKLMLGRTGGGQEAVKPSLFKARKMLSAKKLAGLGKLGPESIGYSAIEGSKQTFKSAENALMFKELADSPHYSIPKISRKTPTSPIVLTGNLQSRLATINGREFVKMPLDRKYGALRGHWVPRHDATSILKANKETNKIMRAYLQALGIWKTGKVALSPTAMGRNVGAGNPLLMIFSGIPAGAAFKHTLSAATKFADKGFNTIIGRAYVKYGGLGKSFTEEELLKESSGLKRGFWNKIKGGIQKSGSLYGGAEHIAKMATMEYFVSKGISYREAFKRAQKILFDYGDVSKFINIIRKMPIGAPFVTFPSKAIPLMFKSALSQPTRVVNAIVARDVWNKHMQENLKLTDANMALIRQRYGAWFLITGGTPQKPYVTDLSYLIPGTEATGAQEKEQGGGWIPGLPSGLQPGGPLLSAAEAHPMINKTAYFGNPIVRPEDMDLKESIEKFKELSKTTGPIQSLRAVLAQSGPAKRALHLWRTAAPANPLVPGTYQQEKLKSATKGTPLTFSGDTMDPWTAWISQFGFKSAPMNLKQAQRSNLIKGRRGMKDTAMALAMMQQNKKLSEDEIEARKKLFKLLLKSRQKKMKGR